MESLPPQYYGPDSQVTRSIIGDGSEIYGTVEQSVIGSDVVIGEGAHIGERPELIEDKDQWGVAVIGHNVNVSDKAVAPPKAMISKDI